MSIHSASNGFFSIDPEMFFYKNTYLHFLFSKIYYLKFPHAYNISVFNNFIVSASSILIFDLFKKHFGDKNSLKLTFVYSILPLNILVSTVFRDYFGNFLVLIGLYVLLNISKNESKLYVILKIIAVSLLISLHRPIYAFFPIIFYTLKILYEKKSLKELIFFILTLLFITIIYNYLPFIFNSPFEQIEHYYSKYGNSRNLFRRIAVSFYGPFPWKDILFTVKLDDVNFLNPFQYLSSVLFISFSALCLFYNKYLRKVEFLRNSAIIFILFYLSSLITIDVHLSYYHNVLFLLSPIMILKKKYIIIAFSFTFFIVSNIFFHVFA